MKNIIYLATVLCICITGMYSCKKNSSIPHKIIDADLKGAFDFQPGTYWIFKDSLTGQVDSFYVRNNWSSVYTNASPSFTYDAIIVDIKEVNEYPFGLDTSMWEITMDQSEVGFSDWYGSYYLNLDPTTYPFTSGIQPYAVYPHTVNLFNSFSSNGSTFNNIAEIHFTSTIDDYLYIDNNVCFIKMILNQPGISERIWEIQRWNIVK